MSALNYKGPAAGTGGPSVSPPWTGQHAKDTPKSEEFKDTFAGNHRRAAFAVLTADVRLDRKAGQFLGGIAFFDGALTSAQRDWLDQLLKRAGLPALGVRS